MDVINLISKVQTFPDAAVVYPGRKYQPGDKYFANGEHSTSSSASGFSMTNLNSRTAFARIPERDKPEGTIEI